MTIPTVPSDTDRLAEIRARLDALAPIPAPWEAWDHEGETNIGADAGQFVAHIGKSTWPNTPLAAELIANAPSDLEWLLSERERLLAHNGVLVTEIRFQAERAEKAVKVLAAYKRAKQENDDRFLNERDEARAEVQSLQGRLDTAEADLAALEPIAAPHRMTADQRERYRRHASWEGAEHYMKQAEAAARRWQREADWLREFRDERKAETEAGTWPLPGDFDCCERHPARALGLGEGDGQ